jgi:hypothetical protein
MRGRKTELLTHRREEVGQLESCSSIWSQFVPAFDGCFMKGALPRSAFDDRHLKPRAGQVRMKLPVLPTYYYLDHFTEMLSFVEMTYATVLDAAHHEFIRDFRNLSADEQCLFVRMVNRRGHIFESAALKYAEIADIAMAVQGLLYRGYLRGLCEDDYAAWLCVLPKVRLLYIARGAALRKHQEFMGETAPHRSSIDTSTVRRRCASNRCRFAPRACGNAAA